MKILQITNKTPVPARDGGSIATFRLSCGLVKTGHEVTVLSMNTSKHYIAEDLWEPVAKSEGFRLIPVDINTNINIVEGIVNFLFSGKPYSGIRFYDRNFKLKLKNILQNNDFDLIIIENLYPFLYLPIIKKLSSAKIVMRAHNIEHEIWERTASNTEGLKGRYLKNLAKRIKRLEIDLINQYDYLAPITERDLSVFNVLGNTKPALALPTGIDLGEYCKAVNFEKAGEIAHLGALDWAPNQEGLIWFLETVWPLVQAKIPNAVFHIAGRNAPMWFEKKLSKYNVQYHGEVISANDFICHFPIHIVPLWSGSGMRIKIIEAMARARIIVTTPIGVEGIAALNNRDLIIRSNPDDFSEAIVELVSNKSKLDEISKNAFNFVADNFENTKIVERFIRFIKEHDHNS
jgi:glycosyltransferase involved in cell wall biosynthesis